jgi:hypothetical protein
MNSRKFKSVTQRALLKPTPVVVLGAFVIPTLRDWLQA